MKFLNQYKYPIKKHISSYKKQCITNTPLIDPLQREMINSLFEFSIKGKLIRGSLLLYTHSLFNTWNSSEIIKVASALEIFHSCLLIHDDIIDNDQTRRGQESVWKHFSRSLQDDAYGKSLAICIGDLGFFAAYNILLDTALPDQMVKNLLGVFSRELYYVAIAEAADTYHGYSNTIPSKKTVEQIYMYKTARYSFSLPMELACILGNDKTLKTSMQKFGETIGFLYQLKDDELGIIGDLVITGKPIGNDILEKKKTYILTTLLEVANHKEKQTIGKILKENEVSKVQQTLIIDLIKKYSIIERVQKLQKKLSDNAYRQIDDLPLKDMYKKNFRKLVDFCLTRKS